MRPRNVALIVAASVVGGAGIIVGIGAAVLKAQRERAAEPAPAVYLGEIDEFAIVDKRDGSHQVWFTLADLDGKPTAMDGTAEVVCPGERLQSPPICKATWNVRARDFRRARVGRGAFEREVLLWSNTVYCLHRPHGGPSSCEVELTFTSATGSKRWKHDNVFLE